jgi:hypothetical protein
MRIAGCWGEGLPPPDFSGKNYKNTEKIGNKETVWGYP